MEEEKKDKGEVERGKEGGGGKKKMDNLSASESLLRSAPLIKKGAENV